MDRKEGIDSITLPKERDSQGHPSISIVIPLLNKGPYISRALHSIFTQTYQDFEVIIIDGGSTDNGPDIIHRIGDHRVHFIQQVGKGVSAARNQGVARARAEFVAFLDADDEWMPDHLDTLIRLRKYYPQAGAYTTTCKSKEVDGELQWHRYACIPPPPWEGLLPKFFKSAGLGDPIWTSVSAIPKEVFWEMGGFPVGENFGEDIDLFGRIAFKYPIAFSWTLGGIYHKDLPGRLVESRRIDQEEPFVRHAKTAISTDQLPLEMVEDVREFIARKELLRALWNIKAGNREFAREILSHIETKRRSLEKIRLYLFSFVPFNIFAVTARIKRLKNRS